MSDSGPNYSALRVLDERLQEAAEKGIRRLSIRDLKGVVTWLEYRQHFTAYAISTEDDALRNAKGRGQIELLTTLASELMELAAQQNAEEE